MAISFGGWYAGPLLDHVFDRTSRPELDQSPRSERARAGLVAVYKAQGRSTEATALAQH